MVNKKIILNKNDLILLLAILAIGSILLVFIKVTGQKGDRVVVTVDGAVFGEYDLDQDRQVLIETEAGINLLVIQSGSCFLEDADCPDKLCVKQGTINNVGQSIICLPHRVVISIEGEAEQTYDTMAQ